LETDAIKANQAHLFHRALPAYSRGLADPLRVLSAMVGPGLLIGHIEGWRIVDALYFTFVTGLTIGYGDLTPRHVVSRLLAVVIGLAGIVLTGLVAAVAVEALRATARDARE
jgi:hypothetical protein